MKQSLFDLAHFSGIPVFFEEFIPDRPSLFDNELAECVTAYALANKTIQGICNISATQTIFSITDPNLRENVFAATSGSTSRQRSMVCGMSVALFGHPFASLPEITGFINERDLKLYTAEANSPVFLALKEQIRSDLFYCSEYFGDEYRSGTTVRGVMHQDLQATSFEDNTFDLILTSDVLEHVPDAPKAEREIVRILKPGGVYCFTVPTHPLAPQDTILAEMDPQGNITYFAEPQYHGDPIRKEGILVFRIFSYNGLKTRFESLDCQYNLYKFWSKTLGILDRGDLVHLAKKIPANNSGVESKLGLKYNQTPGQLDPGSDLDTESLLDLKLKDLSKKALLKEIALDARLAEQARYIQTLNEEKTSLLLQMGQLQQWATTLEKQILNKQASSKTQKAFRAVRRIFNRAIHK